MDPKTFPCHNENFPSLVKSPSTENCILARCKALRHLIPPRVCVANCRITSSSSIPRWLPRSRRSPEIHKLKVRTGIVMRWGGGRSHQKGKGKHGEKPSIAVYRIALFALFLFAAPGGSDKLRSFHTDRTIFRTKFEFALCIAEIQSICKYTRRQGDTDPSSIAITSLSGQQQQTLPRYQIHPVYCLPCLPHWTAGEGGLKGGLTHALARYSYLFNNPLLTA